MIASSVFIEDLRGTVLVVILSLAFYAIIRPIFKRYTKQSD